MVKAGKRWFGRILTGLSGSIFRVLKSLQTPVFSCCEIDDRFKIIAPIEECLEDLRSSTHTKHSLIPRGPKNLFWIAVAKAAA
jgi:hypothetical protein